MTTIVTKFVKFGYNHLPMGMCASGGIFQAEVDYLIIDIKGVEMYTDDILVLSKVFFPKCMDHLRVFFDRLHRSVMEFNTLKCSFGLKDIPYLGYVIT